MKKNLQLSIDYFIHWLILEREEFLITHNPFENMILLDFIQRSLPWLSFHTVFSQMPFSYWQLSAVNSYLISRVFYDTSPLRFYPWLSLCSLHQVTHMPSSYTCSCLHADSSPNNILNLILSPSSYTWAGGHSLVLVGFLLFLSPFFAYSLGICLSCYSQSFAVFVLIEVVAGDIIAI